MDAAGGPNKRGAVFGTGSLRRTYYHPRTSGGPSGGGTSADEHVAALEAKIERLRSRDERREAEVRELRADSRRVHAYYQSVIPTLCWSIGVAAPDPLEPKPQAELEPEPSTHAEPSTAATAQVCINITH